MLASRFRLSSLRFGFIIYVFVCTGALEAQGQVQKRILLRATDRCTYYSNDDLRTIHKIDQDEIVITSELTPNVLLPQSPDNMIWQKAFEGLSDFGDSTYSIPTVLIPLKNGGYFCASIGINMLNRFLRVDPNGEPNWTVYKGDLSLPLFISTCEESGQDIHCSGWRQGSAVYALGGYVYSIAFAEDGSVKRSYHNYSKEGWIKGNTYFGLSATPGGFASLGWIDLSADDTDHVVLNYASTDTQGNKLVDTTYDLWSNHTLNTESALAEEDGSTVFCVGRTYPYQPKVFNVSDIILLKIDRYGNILWSNNIGGYDELLQPRQMIKDPDGYVIVGSTFLRDPEGWAIFVLKTDLEGNRRWLKMHRAGGHTSATSIARLGDGGYVIGGTTADYSRNQPLWWTKDMFLLRVNSTGEKLWDRFWGNDSVGDAITTVSEDRDGNILVAGYVGATDYFVLSNARLYIAKLSATAASVRPTDVQAISRPVVFPNPCSEYLKIDIADNPVFDEIEIVNSLGVVVSRYWPQPSETVLTLNVADLPGGIYFVRADSVLTSFVRE